MLTHIRPGILLPIANYILEFLQATFSLEVPESLESGFEVSHGQFVLPAGNSWGGSKKWS